MKDWEKENRAQTKFGDDGYVIDCVYFVTVTYVYLNLPSWKL